MPETKTRKMKVVLSGEFTHEVEVPMVASDNEFEDAIREALDSAWDKVHSEDMAGLNLLEVFDEQVYTWEKFRGGTGTISCHEDSHWVEWKIPKKEKT